jgi:hypothetical protein
VEDSEYVQYIPDFDSCWPGVWMVVELYKRSSFVLTAGTKPSGVCACAIPTRAVRKREVVYMMEERTKSTILGSSDQKRWILE